MNTRLFITSSLLFMNLASAAYADIAKPNLVLDQMVSALPKADESEIRVLAATLKPGDKTLKHTHRFPVTVYVAEGEFTLEAKGKPPITMKAGQAFVELPGVETTGYNHSTDKVTKVLIFYVSAPNTPFLDPIK